MDVITTLNKVLKHIGLAIAHYSFQITYYQSGKLRICGIFPSIWHKGKGHHEGWGIVKIKRIPYLMLDKKDGE